MICSLFEINSRIAGCLNSDSHNFWKKRKNEVYSWIRWTEPYWHLWGLRGTTKCIYNARGSSDKAAINSIGENSYAQRSFSNKSVLILTEIFFLNWSLSKKVQTSTHGQEIVGASSQSWKISEWLMITRNHYQRLRPWANSCKSSYRAELHL